jgi:hypothetical protein
LITPSFYPGYLVFMGGVPLPRKIHPFLAWGSLVKQFTRDPRAKNGVSWGVLNSGGELVIRVSQNSLSSWSSTNQVGLVCKLLTEKYCRKYLQNCTGVFMGFLLGNYELIRFGYIPGIIFDLPFDFFAGNMHFWKYLNWFSTFKNR